MVVAWDASLPMPFVRSTYERQPEDVVVLSEVEFGPPLRFLRAASRSQTVRGEFPWNVAQVDAFEVWRKSELIHQREPFSFSLYDHPSPRSLTMRMIAPPVTRARSKSSRRVRVEMRSEAPAPSSGTLSALAALHKAEPAAWPVGVPGCPRLQSYQFEPEVRAAFSDQRNSPGGALMTALEGGRESVALVMSSAELLAFEVWFETTAALGVRDILFPVPGGVHTGCFLGTYTVSGSADFSGWLVTFQRYLEARA